MKSVRFAMLRPMMGGLAAAGLGLGFAWQPWRENAAPVEEPEPIFEVASRGDIETKLEAEGVLEAANQVKVTNPLPGTTQILSLVAEGSEVEAGDLLMELDPAYVDDQLSQASISHQKAALAVVEQEARLETLGSENVIRLRDAELAAELAAADLRKYREGEWPQLRKKVDAAVSLATEELGRARERLEGTRRLEEKGYASPSELRADRLAVQRHEIQLQAAVEERRMLTEFDHPRSLRQLEADEENARVRLERIARQHELQLEKAQQQLASMRETLDLRKAKLDELRAVRKLARVVAPQDGVVIYPLTPGSEPLREGSQVRERQELLVLADISRMKVRVNLDPIQQRQVRPGQSAVVTLSAVPGHAFEGEVREVARLPEFARRGDSFALVFPVEVALEGNLPTLRPGIEANAAIVVEQRKDVLRVPRSAVVVADGENYCFVKREGALVPVPVEIGHASDGFIEISSGIAEGESVAVAPPADAEALLPRRLPAAPVTQGELVAAP